MQRRQPPPDVPERDTQPAASSAERPSARPLPATGDDAEHVLCRFQLSTRARHGRASLYEWIVETALAVGLRGATVLEGFQGMGAEGDLLDEHQWTLAQDRAVIVEVIDGPSSIESLLARVEPVFRDGVITLERAHVRRPGDAAAGGGAGRGAHVLATTASSMAGGVRTMKIPEEGILLRIFIGESDRDPERGGPLSEAIVRRARAAHLAGATVLRGGMGFGRHSRVHTARMLDLSTDLPIVIEIVDAAEKIDAFLPEVDALVREGLVTLEAVRVVKYVSPEAR
jgi:uncharacterized protein